MLTEIYYMVTMVISIGCVSVILLVLDDMIDRTKRKK